MFLLKGLRGGTRLGAKGAVDTTQLRESLLVQELLPTFDGRSPRTQAKDRGTFLRFFERCGRVGVHETGRAERATRLERDQCGMGERAEAAIRRKGEPQRLQAFLKHQNLGATVSMTQNPIPQMRGSADQEPVGVPLSLAGRIQVNPVSPDVLLKIKRWVMRPSATGTAAPGDALFSTFTGLFLQRIGDAERQQKFSTQAQLPVTIHSKANQ